MSAFSQEISFNPAVLLHQNQLGMLREDDNDSPPTSQISSKPPAASQHHAPQSSLSSSPTRNTHVPLQTRNSPSRSPKRLGRPGPQFYSSIENPLDNLTPGAMTAPTVASRTQKRLDRPGPRPGPQFHSSVNSKELDNLTPAMMRMTTSAGTRSSINTPPLKERDQRGRPDDDAPIDIINNKMNNKMPPTTKTATASLDQDVSERSLSPISQPSQPSRYGSEVRRTGIQLGSRSAARDDQFLYDENEDEDEHKISYRATAPAPTLQREQSSPFSPSQPARSVASAASAGKASRGPPPPDQVARMMRMLSLRDDSGKDQFQKEQTIHDIPVVLHCLNMDQVNPYMREKAFRSLKTIIWKNGSEARTTIQQFDGVDTLVKNMWADMGNASVQEAALQFLFALCASADGHSSSDVLSNEEAICDALLFAMQTHALVEKIQAAGCGILACLAAASATNKSISDGSLSGALSMVVTAIENHNSSLPLIKAGIQALYSQCVFSANAESNKRSLMDSNGAHVISHVLQVLHDDVVALEWAMKLSWIVTGAEDLMWKFSEIPNIMAHILQTCQMYAPNPNASELIEAILGVVGNMTYLENNRVEMASAGCISVLLDAMRYQRNHCGVNVEACAVLANLAVVPSIREEISRAGGVGSVIRAFQTYLDQEEIAEEALRALVCLANHSPETKKVLATPEVVNSIARACQTHESSSVVIELSCSLLATLSAGESINLDVIIDNEVIARALSCPGEKVQEAACTAFRNLTCKVRGSDEFLRSGVQVGQLTHAMSAHENSLSIQTNVCASLWNLAFKTRQDPSSIIDSAGVRSIVKAMQNHMESGDLLEVACGALWSLVDDSHDRKKDVVGNGAIDAVTCALVMHPGRPDTLVKACGVLSNVSFEGPFAEAIANAQGVSVVVEAMRSNSSSVPLLTTGCIVLRNIVVQYPDFVEEASGAVSTTINAMRDNPDEVAFQEEACTLLWILAAHGGWEIQSKICALDGIAVLMKTLEHNSDIAEVQEAALGAFNQLAATTNALNA